MKHLVLIFATSALAACGPPKVDPPIDAGTPPVDDAGPGDSGTPGEDAGPEPDAGTPPDTLLVTRPPDTITTPATELTFTSDDGTATFECALDAAPFTACASPAQLSNLSDDVHTFQVRARSAAGIADPTPAIATWVVDTQPPDTFLDSGPTASPSGTGAAFEFSSSDEESSFTCALDSAVFTPCTSPFVVTSTLLPGPHEFQVRATDLAGNTDPTPAAVQWTFTGERVRLMAANLSSGGSQSYDPGEGVRIFQGLDPDIVLIQEFNYGTNTPADHRAFVDLAFGAGFHFARESGPSIALPNGVISRYPIVASGSWDDPLTTNREFFWAQLDVPGPKDLWVVSLHLLTTGSSDRNAEAQALVAEIVANVPSAGLLAIGGDLNTGGRGELAIAALSQLVVTDPALAPYPADQNGNSDTNTNRNKPYDWLLVDADLNTYATPLVIGGSTYPAGLVFDSRVYTPLWEVAPVQVNDSAALNMQHMSVLRDFVLPL